MSAGRPLGSSIAAYDPEMSEAAVIALLTLWPETDLSSVIQSARGGHLHMRAAILAVFPGPPAVAGMDVTLIDLHAAALKVLGAIGLMDLERQTAPHTITPRALISYGRAIQAFEAAVGARQLALTRNRDAKAGDWQAVARAAVASSAAEHGAMSFEQALAAARPVAASANVSIETLKRRLREWPETAALPGKGRRAN